MALWGPVALQMAVIFATSSIPGAQTPDVGLSDKHLHFIFYGLLAGLLVRAVSGGAWHGVTVWRAVLAVILAAAYGASDEIHQRVVPGRTAELADLAADAIGAASVAGAIWAWGIIRTKIDDVRESADRA